MSNLTLAAIEEQLAELGPPPSRPTTVHLACSYKDSPYWMRWLAEKFASDWSWFPVFWRDSLLDKAFPCPGVLIFWSDGTLSWTAFECKLSEKPKGDR